MGHASSPRLCVEQSVVAGVRAQVATHQPHRFDRPHRTFVRVEQGEVGRDLIRRQPVAGPRECDVRPQLLFNSTAAERAVVARQHADAAVLLDRRARALLYAGVMLRRWWDSPGATLRTALDEAPRELSETVQARLREVGLAVD
jgi:hypothetical protein